MSKVLKEIYGDQWNEKLNLAYQKIEKRLHMNLGEKEPDIRNSREKRIYSALSDYPKLFGILGFDVGHQGEAIDPSLLHQPFFGKAELEKLQICSEFASRSTAATMIELNKQLSKKINGHFKYQMDLIAIITKLKKLGKTVPKEVEEYVKSKDPKQEQALNDFLESQGYSPEQMALIIRLHKEEVFDLPYSKNERFETIHPGRMVELLRPCLQKEDLPKEVSDLFEI
jgi:hypothetical protein